MPFRPLVCALSGLVAISAGLVQPVQGARASTSPVPMPASHYGRLEPPVRVLPGATTPNAEATAVQPPSLRRSRAGDFSSAVPVAALSPHVATAAQLPLAGFPLMSLQQQLGLSGNDQAVAPPDTQLAAGPTYLAEANNSTLSVWTKQGTLVKSADLNGFFPHPTGQVFTDPRLLYDAESARWILTGLTYNPSTIDSTVFIAVSTTSDPTAAWNGGAVASRTATVADQPETGVSTDKVVISWDDFTGITQTAAFVGEETIVLQKSDLLAGTAPQFKLFGQDVKRARIVPAQSLSATTTQWLTYNNADCALSCNAGGPTIGVIAISGTPSAGNVAWNESDPSIQPTSAPPNPRQPGGAPVDQLIDDVFLSSVWQNGTLWVSANDACLPTGDAVARSCLRLISVSTTGATPSVTSDGDVGDAGTDLFYPAVTLNDVGDLFVVYSLSSPSLFPSVAAVYRIASTSTLGSAVGFIQGLGKYSVGTMNRWGDYSGAARDPSNPADVWLTGEYQASATDPTDWGTFTGRLAVQPSVASLTPSLGLVGGGQSVMLNGDHFQQGATVNFGPNPATNVTVVSETQIKVTAPAATGAATVDVTVTQPDGTTVTAKSAYTYSTALGTAYTAVPPTRLLDTRQQTAGPLGPGKTINLTVSGGTTGVPAGAQTVVLNVTATNTTAGSFLTVYPAGSTRPLASNLNWFAGKTVPNLVAVPVGAGESVTFYNAAGSADVVVDLEGYFAPLNGTAGEFKPLAPSRILDTRTAAKLGPAATMNLPVTNKGGVPTTGVSAVVMNVTATNPTAASYLTLWPAGAPMQTASNLNFSAGATVANRVIVPVGTGGQVSIFNGAGSTDVVADVNGYFTDPAGSSGQLMVPVSPVRILDTRTSAQTLAAGRSVSVPIAGANAVPANATAAILNVTATNTTSASFFTVFPGTGTQPLASDLNWIAGWTVPNLAVVKLGAGSASIYNGAGSADAVVDAFGYFVPSPGVAVTAQPGRIPAAAGSTSSIVATVTLPDGTAPSGDTVTFSTSGGASCGTITAGPTTDATGTVSVTYTATTTAGACTVTATDAARSFTGAVVITQT